VRLLSWIGVFAAMLCTSRAASAYPWMIRHQYQGCVPCHADPSGAGLLTEYGRAMGENIMRSRYGVPAPDEPSKVGRFLFGVPTPDWLLLGGSVRNGVQISKSGSNPFDAPRVLQMEADLKAQLTFSRFRAYGSLGYMHEGAQLTQLTQRAGDNLVSREHWLGVDLDEDRTMLLRAGRIPIPFGIRNDEHDLLVRSTGTTRTNINESQQHGVALNYNGSVVRAELMALLGNYQLNEAFRERGYAGYLEVLVAQSMAVGASSMVTYAKNDLVSQAPSTIRQVHGAFARLCPTEPLVLMIEADALISTSGQSTVATAGTRGGFVGLVQADVEPTQGLHLIATGEMRSNSGLAGASTDYSFAGGAAALWFFAPHADLRFDFVAASSAGSAVSIYMLPQLHLFL